MLSEHNLIMGNVKEEDVSVIWDRIEKECIGDGKNPYRPISDEVEYSHEELRKQYGIDLSHEETEKRCEHLKGKCTNNTISESEIEELLDIVDYLNHLHIEKVYGQAIKGFKKFISESETLIKKLENL